MASGLRTRRPGARLRRRKPGGLRWRLSRFGRWRIRLPRFLPSWRLVRWVLVAGVMLFMVASAALAVAAYLYWPTDLPSVKALEEYAPTPGTKVYADDDELLTEFQAERRIFVPLREIPRPLRDAVIAIEDARFYSHFGVDLRGIARAAYENFRRNRIVEGGSTITQQLAKVLSSPPIAASSGRSRKPCSRSSWRSVTPRTGCSRST